MFDSNDLDFIYEMLDEWLFDWKETRRVGMCNDSELREQRVRVERLRRKVIAALKQEAAS